VIDMNRPLLYLLVPLAPLAGAVIVGLFGRQLGRRLSHWLCIAGVGVALAASVVVVLSLGSGLGLGWVSALDVPQRAYTMLAPFTAFGELVKTVLAHFGWPTGWVLPVLRPAGSVVGLAVAALLVTRAERLGGTLALGLALLAVAATTPAVWPWYMVWGLVFVATVTMPTVLQVAVVALNLALTPLGPGSLDVTHRPNASALFMMLVVLGGGVILWRTSSAGRRDGLHATPEVDRVR